MTPAVIPLDAIDPDRQHRVWAHEFEYHLDLIPPIIDAITMITIPHIRATQTDRPRITGGGYIDNVDLAQLRVTDDGHLVDAGAAKDAAELWQWLTAYTDAAHAWTNTDTPPPALTAKPPADPGAARAAALTAVGWLIDHATLIEPIHELDGHRTAMFTLIRSLRGRYGVHPTPRRPRARCTVCGRRTVTVIWADNPNGGPKPIRIAKCADCGETYTESASA